MTRSQFRRAWCCAVAAAFVALALTLAPRWGWGDPLSEVRATDLPSEARVTLALIMQGGPFPHRRDGSIFRNFERRLPAREAPGYYREYTVPTPGVRTRGARRIVAGRGASGDVRTSGEYYYTDDHYRSFRRITGIDQRN